LRTGGTFRALGTGGKQVDQVFDSGELLPEAVRVDVLAVLRPVGIVRHGGGKRGRL
jgi:hypothetical protein